MTTRRNKRGAGAACAAALVLPAILLTGCGPADDPVGVEPMESNGREAPALGDTQPENTALDNEIDPMRDDDIGDPEQYLFAEAGLSAVDASGVSGDIFFRQRGEVLEISGNVAGLAPGEHGLHVYETGDCSGPGAMAAGPHFSPDGHPHGSPQRPDAEHHAGDLGNITADENGNADFDLVDTELHLGSDSNSIIGRAVIIHAGADDLVTQPDGAAGKAVGCAIIEPDPRPAYVP